MSKKKLQARNFKSAHEDAMAPVPAPDYDAPGSAYRLAFLDEQFLLRESMRPVRMQLELLKPELM